MLSLSHVVVFISDTVNMTGLNVKSKTLYRNNRNVYLPLDFLAIDTNRSQIKILSQISFISLYNTTYMDDISMLLFNIHPYGSY